MAENEKLILEYGCMDFTQFPNRPAIKFITNFFLSSQRCPVYRGPAAYYSAFSARFLQSCVKPYFPKQKVDFVMLLVQKNESTKWKSPVEMEMEEWFLPHNCLNEF